MNWVVDDIIVEVEHRSVRSLRLTIYPDGRVKLVIPYFTTESQARQFLLSKNVWLKNKLSRIKERKQVEQDESKVMLFGQWLPIVQTQVSGSIGVVRFADELRLYCRPNTSKQQKKAMIDAYLRNELYKYLTLSVEQYRVEFQEKTVTWKIRNMKTEWGSCMAKKRSLLFNLQLAHKPLPLIDYVVVHELCHLQVQNHGPQFKQLMTQRMPDWEIRKKRLNN